MRKTAKIELERTLYGLSLGQCPKHNLPLVRHTINFNDMIPKELQKKLGTETDVEGCWDCPAEGCQYHVHENPVVTKNLFFGT